MSASERCHATVTQVAAVGIVEEGERRGFTRVTTEGSKERMNTFCSYLFLILPGGAEEREEVVAPATLVGGGLTYCYTL